MWSGWSKILTGAAVILLAAYNLKPVNGLLPPSAGTTITTTTSTETTTPPETLEPWGKAQIDYMFARDLHKDITGSDNVSLRDRGPEIIHNARRGVVGRIHGKIEEARLDRIGFELCHSSCHLDSFEDLNDVRELYLPDLEEIIAKSLKEPIHQIFWTYPVFRKEGVATRLNLSGDADRPSGDGGGVSGGMVQVRTQVSSAHMDYSFAYTSPAKSRYEARERMETRLPAHMFAHAPPPPDGSGGASQQKRQRRWIREKIRRDVNNALQEITVNQKRFVILNFWRNIGDGPVRRAPLGLYTAPDGFPMMTMSPSADVGLDNQSSEATDDDDDGVSKWYTFPLMTRDEVLVFKQFDRCQNRPCDIWHCALDVGDKKGPPRKSMEIRALVVMNEFVEPENDRYMIRN